MKENQEIDNELKDKEGNIININSETSLSGDDLVDKKTLKKYRIHWYQKIPYPVRALFIKYWFFGLNYFLFMVGIGSLSYFQSTELFGFKSLLLMFICGFALGVFNDLFVYNILDVIEDYPLQSRRYMFFKSKKVYSLFINTLYGLILGMGSLLLCGILARVVYESTEIDFLFREPFTVALVEFLIDLVIVELKNLIVGLFKKSKD